MRPVEFKELAGSTRLFIDFIECNNQRINLFDCDFRAIASYIKTAVEIDKKSYSRDLLYTIINQGTSSIDLSQKTRENIKRLSQPDSLIVFAGQQVGMLLGPTYTIYKALTAFKLAKWLESELHRPVIPCFWMATDDHDFDEIKSSYFLSRDGELNDSTYIPSKYESGLPMANIKIDDGIQGFLRSLKENLIETEFTGQIIELAEELYKPGRPLAEAFAMLFDRLLGEYGIVPVDPNYPGMKKLMSPVFQSEIENHIKAFDLFENKSRQLLDAGYHRQVHKTSSMLNLFYLEGIRRNIVFAGGLFQLDGHSDKLDKNRLMGMLASSPERFSPNVLLRPIAQCHAFPTVAQIVGPSEAAYFAQIEPLYRLYDVPWPVIRPRIFASIIEPHISKLMKKLSISFDSLHNDREHEISRVIKDKFLSDLQGDIELLKSKIGKSFVEFSTPMEKTDNESYQLIDHYKKRIDHELNHLAERLLATHKKRHDMVKGQIERTASFLFPGGKFQERILSPIYFANKFGPDIFKKIESKLELDSLGHQLIEADP